MTTAASDRAEVRVTGGRSTPALASLHAPGLPWAPRDPDLTGDQEVAGDLVAGAVAAMAEFVSSLDPRRLNGADAVTLYTHLAKLERFVVAGKTLLAPRIDATGAWKDSGHRNASTFLAALDGGSPGRARQTLQVGRRVDGLDACGDALRRGELSGQKLGEVTTAATLEPAAESALLAGVEDLPLHEVRDRCRRVRATSSRHDPSAAAARIHAERYFRSWTDDDGAFCFQGRDTLDRGARLLGRIERTARKLREQERRLRPPGTEGAPEPAIRADAFFLTVCGEASGGAPVPRAAGAGDGTAGAPGVDGSGATPIASSFLSGDDDDPGPPSDVAPTPGDPGSRSVVERAPGAAVIVRVDLDALRRGRAGPGEVCEALGLGPIPVPMARNMLDDGYLTYVFHQAGDIRAVSHRTRTVNRVLRTALAERDRTCVVPGCGVSWGLEIDHVVEFSEGGPTELDNLALLCHHHHFLKTFEGWVLERNCAPGGAVAWRFTKLPPFGQEPGLGVDTPEGRAEWHAVRSEADPEATASVVRSPHRSG